MNKLNSSFVQSLACTAVFAMIFGVIFACGGGRSMQTVTNPIGGAAGAVVRLVNRLSPTTVAIPAGLSGNQPLMAAFFQTQQGSQIQQSFQA